MLVACGGGDDAGDGGDGGDGGTGSRVHRYVDMAVPASAAQLNVQGALGYRYIGLKGYTAATRTLLVNDAAVAYTYEVLATPADIVTFVDQIKAQGVRGFRLARYSTQDATYVQVTNSTEKFTYEAADRTVGGVPSATFLASANQRGAAGFRLHFVLVSGGQYVDIWERSSVPATYMVRMEEPAVSEAALLTRFDANGQAGYRFHSLQQFADGNAWMFERNTNAANEKATFRYFTDANVTNLSDLVAQANQQGAKGRGFDGALNVAGTTRHLYFLATNCGGLLCDTRGPAF
jgi:hypothetical protein